MSDPQTEGAADPAPHVSRVSSAAASPNRAPPVDHPMDQPDAKRFTVDLRVYLIAIGVTVVVVTIVSLVLLSGRHDDDQWTPVLQDVLKIGYQAVAVGALGGLAKLVLDRRRAA